MRLKVKIGKGINHKVYVILPNGEEEIIEGVFGIQIKARARQIAHMEMSIFMKDIDVEYEQAETKKD